MYLDMFLHIFVNCKQLSRCFTVPVHSDTQYKDVEVITGLHLLGSSEDIDIWTYLDASADQ